MNLCIETMNLWDIFLHNPMVIIVCHWNLKQSKCTPDDKPIINEEHSWTVANSLETKFPEFNGGKK